MSYLPANPATTTTPGIVQFGTTAGTAAQGNDTHITGAEQTTNKGTASGYAPLDATSRLPTANLPLGITGGVNFQGTWNASTNTPALASGTGTKGFLYRVSVAGTTTLDGIGTWNVGDDAVFDGTVWSKLDGLATEVTSVAGRVGAVTLLAADVGGLAVVATSGSYNDLLNKPAGTSFTSTAYTAAGAIAPTDDESVINTAASVTMTLAAGAGGHLISIKHYGAGAVTVTGSFDGTSQSIIMSSTAGIKECLAVRYNAALATWLVE